MVGRCNKNQARGLRQKMEDEDMISQLPDALICQILDHLPTKDVVKTSVLSTRWRILWLWVPNLDLASRHFQDFNAFLSFSDGFFVSSRVSCIFKVKLSIDEIIEDGLDLALYLKSWIDSAVKHKIQHLNVRCRPYFYHEIPMPSSLYICETLVSLKLFQVNITNAEFVVSLPCVKTMCLEDCLYPNEATFERLVSCCPVLEDLMINIAWHNREFFRVQSRSLKRLTLVRVSLFEFNTVPGVVIDAPLLCKLSINDHVSESFSVNSLGSNAKLDISLLFGLSDIDEASVSARRNSIRKFLSGISSVREMIIYPRTFEVICVYSKLELLPQFDCMNRLCVTLCASSLEWWSTFLESCPNLKSLILDWDDKSEKMPINEWSQIRFASVPKCLLSSLEFVHIKSTILGYAGELKVVRYLLENSTILKRLTVCLHHAIQDDFVKKLDKIKKRSVACQVVVLGLEKTVEMNISIYECVNLSFDWYLQLTYRSRNIKMLNDNDFRCFSGNLFVFVCENCVCSCVLNFRGGPLQVKLTNKRREQK